MKRGDGANPPSLQLWRRMEMGVEGTSCFFLWKSEQTPILPPPQLPQFASVREKVRASSLVSSTQGQGANSNWWCCVLLGRLDNSSNNDSDAIIVIVVYLSSISKQKVQVLYDSTNTVTPNPLSSIIHDEVNDNVNKSMQGPCSMQVFVLKCTNKWAWVPAAPRRDLTLLNVPESQCGLFSSWEIKYYINLRQKKTSASAQATTAGRLQQHSATYTPSNLESAWQVLHFVTLIN